MSVTVNGKPLAEWLDKELSGEIKESAVEHQKIPRYFRPTIRYTDTKEEPGSVKIFTDEEIRQYGGDMTIHENILKTLKEHASQHKGISTVEILEHIGVPYTKLSSVSGTLTSIYNALGNHDRGQRYLRRYRESGSARYVYMLTEKGDNASVEELMEALKQQPVTPEPKPEPPKPEPNPEPEAQAGFSIPFPLNGSLDINVNFNSRIEIVWGRA